MLSHGYDLWSKTDSQAFARKRRNLHCDAHVAAQNKSTWPLKTNARDRLVYLSNLPLIFMYTYEVAMQKN